VSETRSLRRRLGLAVLLTVVPAALLAPVAAFGFRDASDYILGFSARLLGDLGLARLELAPTLGGMEISRALGQTSPLALVTHTMLFRLLGDSPPAQLSVMILLHLLVTGAAMAVARRWRPERQAGVVVGLFVGLHPLAAGVTGGIAPLGTMAALLCVLGAMWFAMAIVRERRHGLIVAVFLLAVLASGLDVFGLLIVPALLLVSLFAAPHPDLPGPGLRRLEPVIAAVLGVAFTFQVMTVLPETLASWYLLTTWRPNQLGDELVWLLFALTTPVVRGESLTTPARWALAAALALVAVPFFWVTVFKLRRRPALLIWPALLLLSMIPAAVSVEPLRRDMAATSWAAFYPALVFAALWIAEAWPAPNRPNGRLVLGVLLVLMLAPQTLVLSQAQAQRAKTISRLGGEFAALVDNYPNGTDVLLPVEGETSGLVESAFLSAFYRGVQARQVRYRMLVGGRMAMRETAAPTGRGMGLITRLPFHARQEVIGLDVTGRHLVELTTLIATKLRLAQDILEKDRTGPPPLALADETAINAWLDGAVDWQPRPKVGADWFIEGLLLRLHPHTGRVPL
jgi:hypothetical protein